MACLSIKNHATGETRIVSLGLGDSVTTQPGESVVGAGPCGGTPLHQELDEAIGSGGGDWIRAFVKPVAKLLGKEHCSKCEARRIATNAYAKLKDRHGQLEALRIIKDLWQTSATDGDATLVKLQEYLR